MRISDWSSDVCSSDLRTWVDRGVARAETALGAVNASEAIDGPRRQRRVGHGLAGCNVVLNPAGDLLPAGGLPGFERAELPAVTPTDRQIDIARGVGNVGQVIGAVMEQVAETGPQELRLRMRAGAQLGEVLDRKSVG